MKCFKEAVVSRRSIYALNKEIPVLESEIIAAVERMTKEVPSAFNMQSARVIVTMGEHHENVWEITKAALKKIVPADKFSGTEAKLNSFAAGYGTILYFEETDTVKAMQEKFPLYAENFPVWASQANGMLQFAIWTALEDLGLGANIQHYNPLIDEGIKKAFDVPASWNLVAQMVFGGVEKPADAIDKLPVKERVKVFR